MWFRRVAVLLILTCAVDGQMLVERARSALQRRYEKHETLIPFLRSQPTHDFYGLSYTAGLSYVTDPAYANGTGKTHSTQKATGQSSSTQLSRHPHDHYGTSFQPFYATQSSRRQNNNPHRDGPSSTKSTHPAVSRVSEEQRQRFQEAQKVISAGNKFGLDLMQYLISENDNTIMAPVSLSIALAMLYFASDGNTMRQLSRALHYDEFGLNPNTIKSPLRSVSAAGKATDNTGFTFELGNFLFIQKGLNVSEKYKNTISDVFASSVESVDFSQPDKAIRQINDRITKATRGQIASPFESFSPSTRLILTNAVYFKGFWKQPFSVRSSFESTFANDGVNEVPVRMMYMRSNFLIKSLSEVDADAIQLPYDGDMTLMLVLLPRDPQSINRMLESLNVVKLVQDLPTYSNVSLDLHIPRFTVRGSYRFKQHLLDFGVRDLFTPGAANLPEIDANVILEDVIHEAKIQVDERGTEAVAVTTAPIINYSRYPSFTVRHPFVFFVVHKPTAAIFFAGKILRMNDGEAQGPPTGSLTTGSNQRHFGGGRRS
ncbi:leukocyte elastase inhibitor C-like [Tropilaelaps mercedesae]|uniref:Leukocyte elastase inhibitor C-like n=1 Tax=Tropilaelaps mercedesae TaxID=418985 RepID=A0A1V9X2M3_9ACAR|nr:leukocyte elastase inhibitor C-like [Tropilaelaps mercedesae]